ncbi:MAG: OsmC family protein [bacterium]
MKKSAVLGILTPTLAQSFNIRGGREVARQSGAMPDCETQEGKVDEVTREITLEGDLNEEQRGRFLEIANRSVHRTLTLEIKVRSCLTEGVPT